VALEAGASSASPLESSAAVENPEAAEMVQEMNLEKAWVTLLDFWKQRG